MIRDDQHAPEALGQHPDVTEVIVRERRLHAWILRVTRRCSRRRTMMIGFHW
jgi:hypothetical protein